ncbi:hypothetical protein [Gandjariella thermophila]|uniref:Uncharacterized protein n=1 Tax=Gandjariella thermophila TaxID=1931992 RepID=A0A4D4JH45_9PSEU|nr:hypothetical protein [Gandjariella thermophila]GDY33958.1 hypothetical protein GTS_55910 [Gandjariella thermophila]
MTTSDPTAGLPPKPDPQTGQPRPPHAPALHTNRTPPESDRDRETRLSRKPEPPPGQGPVLAWYRASWYGTVRLGIVGFVILLVGAAVLGYIKGYGLHVFSLWFTWLVMGLAAVGIAASTRKDWCAAGADWVMHQGAWVLTYELTEIKTRGISNTIYVYLTDKDGRKIDASIDILQSDRLVWDLLYNGMRHSVAKGAALKGTARSALGLHPPTSTPPTTA